MSVSRSNQNIISKTGHVKRVKITRKFLPEYGIYARSRVHERTISLGFLVIILRVLMLEVSLYGFLVWGCGFLVFLLSPLQCTITHYGNCKKLREFEEIEISMQGCRGDCE